MPEIVKITISKILPNEDQPRKRFKAGSIEAMADSLKTIGQQTPIKVRPLTEAEKASYSKEELEWEIPRGRKPDQTLGERGYEYMLIGGHRRREGAMMAGLEALDCFVLDIKPEETHLTALMDNSLEEMDWWDWDLAIEAEHKAFPGMTQRELAKRLGVSKSKVGKALLICKALDENDRYYINLNLDPRCDNEGNLVDMPTEDTDADDNLAPPRGRVKSDYRITESILLALTAIEDPYAIGSAAYMTIKHEFNEAMVNKLIKWCNDGNDPEHFEPPTASQSKTKEPDPLEATWKALPPHIKVKHKGGEDYEIHITVTGGQKTLETAQAAQKTYQEGIFSKLIRS